MKNSCAKSLVCFTDYQLLQVGQQLHCHLLLVGQLACSITTSLRMHDIAVYITCNYVIITDHAHVSVGWLVPSSAQHQKFESSSI